MQHLGCWEQLPVWGPGPGISSSDSNHRAASSLCRRSGSFPGSSDSCPAGTPPSLGSLAGRQLGAGWVVKASSWVSAGVGSQWINPCRAWLRGQTGAKGGSTPILKLLDLSRGLRLHVCFGGRPHSGIKSWVETWPLGLEQVALPLRISEATDPVKVPWEQVAGGRCVQRRIPVARGLPLLSSIHPHSGDSLLSCSLRRPRKHFLVAAPADHTKHDKTRLQPPLNIFCCKLSKRDLRKLLCK